MMKLLLLGVLLSAQSLGPFWQPAPPAIHAPDIWMYSYPDFGPKKPDPCKGEKGADDRQLNRCTWAI